MTSASSKPSFTTSNGEFEACFGKGLDLSEFGSTTSSTGEKPNQPKKSAAQELLRIKSLEKTQREREIFEEQKLNIAIQAQVSSLLQAKQRTNSDNLVVDALVKMHGHDTSEPLYRSKRMGKKKPSQASKSVAAKKARRKTKYSR
jgi:hypothetical protein